MNRPGLIAKSNSASSARAEVEIAADPAAWVASMQHQWSRWIDLPAVAAVSVFARFRLLRVCSRWLRGLKTGRRWSGPTAGSSSQRRASEGAASGAATAGPEAAAGRVQPRGQAPEGASEGAAAAR